MLNTLNYSEAIEAFSSFISSEPKWYIDLKGSYYSFDEDGKCFLHNVENDYNRMKDTIVPDRSFIKLLVNDDYEVTKTFDNVSYSADFSPNENIVPLQFKTRLHTTDKVDFIDSREDTYKFSIPRDNSEDATDLISRIVNYGKLYNWYAVNDPRGLVPSGWHIPSSQEWVDLQDYLGSANISKQLRESGTAHWDFNNNEFYNGLNTSGFTAVGAGSYENGVFSGLLSQATFFCSDDVAGVNAFSASFYALDSTLFINDFNPKKMGRSLRAIKDDGVVGDVTIDGIVYHSVKIGNQVWMLENLATNKYQNGDQIGSDFNSLSGAVISYNNDDNNAYTTTIISGEKALFASRLRGKYMVCDYEFKSNKGYTFRLPYIETTYRYSMI